MNSRNHIMFGAPGEWNYLYGAGLNQANDSIGFAHAVFNPPSKLLQQAANGISFPNGSSQIQVTVTHDIHRLIWCCGYRFDHFAAAALGIRVQDYAPRRICSFMAPASPRLRRGYTCDLWHGE